MCAPIDENFHGLGVVDHDDRRIADVVCLEITRIGCLSLQTNPVPGVTTENPLLFEVVQSLIHKHLIGHPAHAECWQCTSGSSTVVCGMPAIAVSLQGNE